MRPFITKLGTALVQLLVLVIYLAVGVRAVTNQISDLENAASQGLITIAEKTERIGGGAGLGAQRQKAPRCWSA